MRHGETDWNREARLQGQRDVSLNGVGRKQADDVGRKLAAIMDSKAVAFVASPLGRTRETMEILRSALGLPATGYATEEALRELTFGTWEGLTWREVRARDAAAAALRERDKWNFVPPGGESYAQLAVRLGPFLAGIAQDTVVVSHGGVARAALSALCGVPEHEAPRIDIWQGRVLVIEGGRYRWS